LGPWAIVASIDTNDEVVVGFGVGSGVGRELPATGTDGVFGYIPVGREAIITAGGGGEVGVPEGERGNGRDEKCGKIRTNETK